MRVKNDFCSFASGISHKIGDVVLIRQNERAILRWLQAFPKKREAKYIHSFGEKVIDLCVRRHSVIDVDSAWDVAAKLEASQVDPSQKRASWLQNQKD